jgi:hypothetical protein
MTDERAFVREIVTDERLDEELEALCPPLDFSPEVEARIRTLELTRAERRQLRRIERGVLMTDHAWAESVFGPAVRHRPRRRAMVTAAADVATGAALGFGVTTACCHCDRWAWSGRGKSHDVVH